MAAAVPVMSMVGISGMNVRVQDRSILAVFSSSFIASLLSLLSLLSFIHVTGAS